MYYTYILYSEKLDRYYVGQTKDLCQRFTQHNQGRSKSTRGGMPWRLIYYFESEDRTEAIRIEAKIKSRGVRRFLLDSKVEISATQDKGEA